MAAGLSVVNLANVWLDELDGSYLKLHTGDPGSAGAGNASAETLRKLLTFSAAAGGSKSAVATLPSWTPWTVGVETITHVSFWTALTGGLFRCSGTLAVARSMANGDTLNLGSLTFSLTPLAA